jgi:hypothetical protein
MNNMPYDPEIQGYPVENLENMFPEVYHIVYPKVITLCNAFDRPNNPNMYPFPHREMVNCMVDEIYNQTTSEMGYTQDYEETINVQAPFYPEYVDPYDYNRRHRKGHKDPDTRYLRDIISIILLRELLRRRGRRY